MLISAHRDLAMPTAYEISDTERQLQQIHGTATWGNNPVSVPDQKEHRYTAPGSAFRSRDFAQVLNVLATRHMDDVQKFFNQYGTSSEIAKKPKTVFEKAIAIWSACLPDLEINITKTPTIMVRKKDGSGSKFNPEEMSDGERGLFYLVAKCMIAPPGTLIIVDEPETHLHRAIRNRFWDLMESQRSDCAYAYFTHDIDFISTRSFARRTGIYAFESGGGRDRTSGRWKYKIVPSSEEIPDDLYVSVLGSRTDTMLVEGHRGSLDPVLARIVYPYMLVEPLGSCDQVIRSVKALKDTPQLHTTSAFGLIDRDFRTDKQVDELARAQIFTHRFRELENVIASKAAIFAILTNFGRAEEVDSTINKLAGILCERIKSEKNDFVQALSKRQIELAFQKTLNAAAKSGAGLVSAANSFEATEIELSCLSSVEDIIASSDLDRALAIFSIRKNDFQDSYARLLGVKDWNSLKESIDGWCRDCESENGKRMVAAVRECFPKINA